MLFLILSLPTDKKIVDPLLILPLWSQAVRHSLLYVIDVIKISLMEKNETLVLNI